MTASLFAAVDTATEELIDAFWTLVHGVASDTKTPPADVLHYFKRTAIAQLRELKASHGIDRVDDGRAAFWRIRTRICDIHDDCIADSDPERRFTPGEIAPGASVIAGLPSVAREVLAMIELCHAELDPGCAIEGVSEPILLSKLRSLRVALSNQGHNCVWRLRYIVRPPSETGGPVQQHPGHGGLSGATPHAFRAGARREPRHFCAYVYVQREQR